ncbi:hypothetical protein DCC81_03040 [Chitinophaga parva]|uniref:Signal transduction histidine kinase internal region domain-containing protein n=1 Tax=Chitinophaga parva TaxID=2169414 RepID=A0A2T7BLB9_9BACT|nr:hypothetical protein DCC81_03040 [Chitinophaga parva]
MAYFYWRERRIKAAANRALRLQNDTASLELQALQAQMDPHFIFNSLNAIHHFILTTSTELASLYLTRFAKLMRFTITNVNKDLIKLEEDIEALEIYMQLEKLRFEGKFIYQIKLAPELTGKVILVPPLVIQPYVQHAIWHHILQRPQDEGGLLIINIHRRGSALLIRVEDNGVRNNRTEMEHKRQSLVIAAARLHRLSNKFHVGTHIVEEEVLDEQHEHQGNRIIIRIDGELAPMV